MSVPEKPNVWHPADRFGCLRATPKARDLTVAEAYRLLEAAATTRYRRIPPDRAAEHWLKTAPQGAAVLEVLGWRKVRAYWRRHRRPGRVKR